jgi:hypothetical protein
VCVCVFSFILSPSFQSLYNLDQWYEDNLLFVVSLCMSPMRPRYRELGLKLTRLGEDHSHQPKRPPMAEEKRDDGARVPIKLLFKGSLAL